MTNSDQQDTPRPMDFSPTIWNVLHDGCIDRVVGCVPGNVDIEVGCEYLRERFSETGDGFVIRLLNCKRFSFQLYDDEVATTDLKKIGDSAGGILSAEMRGSVCQVFTDVGVLELESDVGSLSLDSGRDVPLRELLTVATEYWEEWESNSNQAVDQSPGKSDD